MNTDTANTVRLLKTEEADEITALANKIKEQHRKQVLAKPSLTISKPIQQPVAPPEPLILPLDWNSIQGQFGWMEIDKCTLPYVIRSERRYIAERMLNAKLFLEYKMLFKEDILGDYVRRYVMSMNEANLLNEINFKHCDSFYGKSVFNSMDLLILSEDAIEMNAFYKFVYKRFVEKTDSKAERCGFIKISGQNCVPYVIINNLPYLPLFYFEGDCQYLEKTAMVIEGWDLIYLKFFCKIQGIRKELYDKEAIQVVDLETVKQYFLPGTVFEEFFLKDNGQLFMDIQSAIFKNGTVKKIQSQSQNNRSTLKLNVQPKTTVNPNVNAFPKNYQVNNNNNTTNSNKPTNVWKPGPLLNLTTNCRYGIGRIPDIACGAQQVPYSFRTVRIGNIFLHRCINMEPFNFDNLLITLEEIANFIFRVPVEKVIHALRAMGLVTYLPNNKQAKMLENVGLKNTRGVIQVDIFKEHLPQLGYILSSAY